MSNMKIQTIDRIWKFSKEEAISYISEDFAGMCDYEILVVAATKDGKWFEATEMANLAFDKNYFTIGNKIDMVATQEFGDPQSKFVELAWMIQNNQMPPPHLEGCVAGNTKCVCGANKIYGPNNNAHSHWCDLAVA